MHCWRIIVIRRGILPGLLFPKALVLVVIGKHEPPCQNATFHPRITRQIIDLGTGIVDFMRATPSSGHCSFPKLFVSRKFY